MNDTNETTYLDRAQAMNEDARDELKKILATENAVFISDVETVKARTISAVNRALKMGDAIKEFTGHKKLALAEYNQFALAINDAPINFAKECLSIREANESVITTYEQAYPIFEHLLIQYELLPKPAHGEQKKHPHEPVLDYIGTVIKADAESVDLLEDHPMEKWERFQISSFANNSKRIHDLHELAERLLSERGEA